MGEGRRLGSAANKDSYQYDAALIDSYTLLHWLADYYKAMLDPDA